MTILHGHVLHLTGWRTIFDVTSGALVTYRITRETGPREDCGLNKHDAQPF
jgi:hypothetical protein